MAEAAVLIVDDDRSIVRLCQRLLERASFKVFASTDPMEAIKILEARKVDLLLSDIRMPVMDGFELIERAKQLQPDLAVLVMTGFGTVDTAIQALYKGVDGLILKPFENPSDLVRAAQRVLASIRERQDAARAQALRPLFDVSETLLAETNPKALEQLISNALEGFYGSCSAGVYRNANNAYQLIIVQGIAEIAEREEWLRMREYILSCSSPGLLNVTGPGEEDLQQAMSALKWGGLLVAPVIRDGAQYIFFATHEASSGSFNGTDLELFLILARQSVVAMENARLYTDLRNSLKRIEESQRALVQAEKMAAVGRLMASLAHEINNPLQAVRNCLHLANRADIDDTQRASYLAMTDSELDRLVKTVRHMLDFYRPGQREKEVVEVGGAVERVLHLLRSQMEHNSIGCDVAIPADCPTIYAVRDQIQQVFFNLVLNSMDAMESMQSGKQIWIDTGIENGRLSLFIEDSGPGIAEELRGNLFEPFVSTKKNGTGLGLAVSYGIIEAHGGQLKVIQPRHRSGACFEIQLPLQKVE